MWVRGSTASFLESCFGVIVTDVLTIYSPDLIKIRNSLPFAVLGASKAKPKRLKFICCVG